MYRVKRIASGSSTVSINGKSITDSFGEVEEKRSGHPRIKRVKRKVVYDKQRDFSARQIGRNLKRIGTDVEILLRKKFDIPLTPNQIHANVRNYRFARLNKDLDSMSRWS